MEFQREMHFKTLSVKWRPFCLGHNVLKRAEISNNLRNFQKDTMHRRVSLHQQERWQTLRSLICEGTIDCLINVQRSVVTVYGIFVIGLPGASYPQTNFRCAEPHDDVIKWKHFPRYWPFVREIHRSPVNFPHKGQWRGALMFSLICARING